MNKQIIKQQFFIEGLWLYSQPQGSNSGPSGAIIQFSLKIKDSPTESVTTKNKKEKGEKRG